ncbi:hypothetical protein O181_054364 [Austropuccinia psidii MF-1]|uniref:Uncharacterized protein n=1 Tax=Austropuccinia psidii MF-1 TaxID=1389203 RepID=A0A9Q3E4F5_9BASI|nr:hypothetical protein [Austropuccinia psidii MF-1]
MASGKRQRPSDELSSIFPLTLRGILSLLHAPCTQGCRSGTYMVLYTIMHHFCSAIQWSRFQDPIPPFQIKVLSSNTHFEGGLLNSSVWKSDDHSRIPKPGPAGVGLAIHSELFQGTILRGYEFFPSVFKASSISILLGQLNWSIEASINQPVCTWPNLANSYSTVGI